MQRLFTSFADGWPGFGLLVQRFVIAATLLHQNPPPFSAAASATWTPKIIGLILAIMIMIGLWTPLSGVLVATFEIWIALLHPRDPETEVLLAVLGATLAMIGPGACSIDSRLFGRKQFRS